MKRSGTNLCVVCVSFATLLGCKEEATSFSIGKDPSRSHASRSLRPPSRAAGDVRTTITKKDLKVGQKRHGHEQNEMSMKVDIDGGNGKKDTKDKTEKHVEERTVETLAVSSGVETKVKVTYGKDEYTPPNKEKAPLGGKTFIVELKSGQLSVTTASGGSVSAEEEKRIKKEQKRLGKEDRFMAAMPASMKKGERIPALEKAYEVMLEEEIEQKADVDNVTVTFAGPETIDGAQAAAFDIVYDVTMDLGAIVIKATRGTAKVRYRVEDGRYLGSELRAKMVLQAGSKLPPGATVKGNASMSGEESVKWDAMP